MLTANVGLIFTVIFWGSLVPVLADLLQSWDPYFLSVVRYGMAVPLLLILRRFLEPGPLLPDGISLLAATAAGALLACFATFYTVGVALSNPITAAVLSACSPVIYGMVEWIGTGVAPRWSFIIALPLTISGAILGSLEINSDDYRWDFQGGEIMIILGSACWATYSFAVKHWLARCSQVRLTSITVTIGVIILLLIYVILMMAGMTRPLIRIPDRDIFKMAWISLGAVVGGVLLWNNGVRKLGVSIAALYLNLIPFVAIATAMWFGIFPRTEQLIGCLLVVVGIFVTQSFGEKEIRSAY